MNRATTILLVDDETSIQQAVTPLLRSRGYEVRGATTAKEALRMFGEQTPDLVVLDLGLPDLEGTEVCRRMRAAEPHMPILVLSARSSETDKVSVLDIGADDYVIKPFGPEELLARIRVALRRRVREDEDLVPTGRLTAGDLTIDYDRRRVVRRIAGGNANIGVARGVVDEPGRDEEIRLTPKEFELLSLLARNADRVLTHRTILKAIWGPNAVDQPEHLWVLVGQLRKKIEPDAASPHYIVSEPWVGYRFVGEPAASP